MRYVRLVAMCDEYDNEPGWVLKGTKPYDGMMVDRSGIMVAHDLLEHQNGIAAIGTVWDELQALGGVHQVRGRHGDLLQDRPSYHSVASNLAADITRMFNEEWDASDAPRTYAHLYDEDFREAIEIARRDISREFNDPRPSSAEIDSYLGVALAGMRIGFRKAERRFGDGYMGYDLFRAIKETVARHRPEFEGEEAILGYGDGRATIRPIEYRD